MTKEVYAWFGDQYIIIPVENVDSDMDEDDIIEAAGDILFSDMSWEVVNGEEG